MFGKRKRVTAPSPSEMFARMRGQILDLDPSAAGLGPKSGTTDPWGFLMETGYPGAVATLVCLRDGTTSLYTSTGFGIIGGGGHESVRVANARVFEVLAAHLSEMSTSADRSLPGEGTTVMRALTFEGQLTYASPEEDLGQGIDRLAPLFHAAQGVITELRLIDEARTS